MVQKWPSIEQLHVSAILFWEIVHDDQITFQTYICLKIGCVRQEMLAKDECITICNVC